MTDQDKPVLFSIDPHTKGALGRIGHRTTCGCLDRKSKGGRPQIPVFHVEAQDESSPGWIALTSYVELLAAKRASVFEPLTHIQWEDWATNITLPASVAGLTEVTNIRLYGSQLRRLPPEIGAMSALEDLDIYTSYSLHWIPYEVVRCRNLCSSRMSTRALYGNRKTGLPFPRLHGPVNTLTPKTCSVCDRPFGSQTPQLWWTTQRIGTDNVPLLVHSCSNDCTASIPAAPAGFHEAPHKGGGGVGMPTHIGW